MISMKEQIKAGVKSLGFLDCAFTPALPVPGFENYQKWIEEDRHAEMAYLATPSALERRADPRLLLPSVKTVISLVSGYPPPPPSTKKASVKIAAYALQRDYHEQISERLKQLLVLIEELSGEQFDALACVDSRSVGASSASGFRSNVTATTVAPIDTAFTRARAITAR